MYKFSKLLMSTAILCVFLSVFSTQVFASTQKTLTITRPNVNLRSGPGTNYKVVGKLNKGKKVSYLGKSGIWDKIKVTNVGTVWVDSTFTSSASASVSKTSRSGSISNRNGGISNRSAELNVGDKIISAAKKYLGVPYVWGGSSPSGFDCSGFVKYVFNKFGVKLDHLASAQANTGTYVSKSNLRTGDLVFFDTDGSHSNINHVGIYIGDGKFIQASSGHSFVIISDLSGGFYANSYMTARRVI